MSIASIATHLEAGRSLIWRAAYYKDHPEACESTGTDALTYDELMACAFTPA